MRPVARNTLLLALLLAVLAACAPGARRTSGETLAGCARVVAISDIHYEKGVTPQAQREMQRKLAVARDISAWEDVALVAVTGDIVARNGTPEEYGEAWEFLEAIAKPRAVVAGNHEYLYADPSGSGRFRRATAGQQREKLERFKKFFDQPQLYYTKTLNGYLLVFLSTDAAGGRFTTEISPEGLGWLEKELAANRALPTLLFFHAPLKGTLENYDPKINGDQRIAQPVEAIRAILAANPQVLLWVSGHTHTPATNPSYKSDVNLYEGRVVNIHNADFKRGTIWTNSIFLCPEEIVVKTWDHEARAWMPGLDRVIPVGREGRSP